MKQNQFFVNLRGHKIMFHHTTHLSNPSSHNIMLSVYPNVREYNARPQSVSSIQSSIHGSIFSFDKSSIDHCENKLGSLSF